MGDAAGKRSHGLGRATSLTPGGLAQLDRVGFEGLFHRLEYAFTGSLTPWLLALAIVFGWNAFEASEGNGVPKLRSALLLLLITFGIHFCMGARSFNCEIRYYFFEIACIYLGVLVLFLRTEWLRWPKRALIAAILGAQLWIYPQAYGFVKGTQYPFASFFEQSGMQPILKWEDPSVDLFRNIAPDLKDTPRPRILIVWMNLADSMGMPRIAEPGNMDLVALENLREIEAKNWGFLETIHGKQMYVHVWDPKEADFIVGGPLETAEPELLKYVKTLGTWRTFKIKSDIGPGREPVDATMILVKR